MCQKHVPKQAICEVLKLFSQKLWIEKESAELSRMAFLQANVPVLGFRAAAEGGFLKNQSGEKCYFIQLPHLFMFITA